MSQFRPMLASNDAIDPENLEMLKAVQYPVLGSPKIDGIRCCIVDGLPRTRKLEPFPNRFIAAQLTDMPAFDGELVVGSETSKNGFDKVQSEIMSEDGEPDWAYFVFDNCHPGTAQLPFSARLQIAERRAPLYGPRVRALEHTWIRDVDQLLHAEKRFLDAGYEGLMLRDPNAPYKWGRSTFQQGALLKVLRKRRAEAVIVGFTEKMHNANEKLKNELGLSKRSSHKANKVPTGMLGAFECVWHDESLQEQVTGKKTTFEVGSGFDHELAARIWRDREEWLGCAITVEFREFTKDGKPRFPVYMGRRAEIDMGAPQWTSGRLR